MTTNIKKFATAPYYDDFNEENNFMRILFRPGYSVQVRELNQLQSAIQAQIDRFGQSIFKDGARVLGGEPSIDNRTPYIKVKETTTFDGQTPVLATYLQTDSDGNYVLEGKSFRGTARGTDASSAGNVTGKILQVEPPLFNDTGNEVAPLTIYVQYTASGGTVNGADDGVKFAPEPDEVLLITIDDDTELPLEVESTTTDTESNTIYPTGFGTRLTISEGVYFTKGCFVHTPADSIIVGRYSINPFRRVVYDIAENIVTAAGDSSLNDNVLESPNAGAPGANRYQIALTLEVDNYHVKHSVFPDAITVATIENGFIKTKDVSELSELGSTLAQRTFEESGNYYLNPFKIVTRELLRDTDNLDPDYHEGLYVEQQLTRLFGDKLDTNTTALEYGQDRLAVLIGENGSVAYVNGYRVEFNDPHVVLMEKARTYKTENNVGMAAKVGNWLTVTYVSGEIPDITNGEINLVAGTNGVVGTALVRNVEYAAAGELKLYITNIAWSAVDTDGVPLYSITDLTDITSAAGFAATIDVGNIYEPGNSSVVFKLPTDVTRSVTDTQYIIRQQNEQTIVSDTELVWALTGDNFFASDRIQDYPVWNENDGLIYPSAVERSANLKTATLTFSSTINGVTKTFANIRRSTSVTTKSKTRRTGTTRVSSPNQVAGLTDQLNHLDIINVNAVYVSANASTLATTEDSNIIDSYVIDNGQRDNYYDYGAIRLRCGCEAPEGQLLIEYEYYEHSGTGDFFTVDSYIDLDTAEDDAEYELIPTFDSIRGTVELRDCIDFRPTIDQITAGTATHLARQPTIICDIEYFLPRYDKIYLTQEGDVGISYGIPSLSPATPNDVDGTMTLYTVQVGAYTFGKDDLTKIPHDHRRYTMRDIGKLDKRIRVLEELHDLTQLESEVANEQFLDDDGSVRYRNGFVTDNCKGHIVGYTRSLDYSVSVDRKEGIVYPQVFQENVRLRFNETLSSNFRRTGSLVTLDYYQVPHIQQSQSSYSGPINSSEWVGNLMLSPATDEWREVSVKPEIAIDDSTNGAFDALLDSNESNPLLAGYIWNEWDEDWAGISRTDGDGIDVESITQNINSSLSGTNAPNAVIETYGSYEVQRNAIPYMRSRKVYFNATGLKANTRYWLFFGGVNIASFARTESSFVVYNENDLSEDPNVANTFTGLTSHPDGSTKLITDGQGNLVGSFIIPNTDNTKILTGVVQVQLFDTPDGVESMSSAQTSYEARGHRIEKATRVLVTTNNASTNPSAPITDQPIDGEDSTGIDNDECNWAAFYLSDPVWWTRDQNRYSSWLQNPHVRNYYDFPYHYSDILYGQVCGAETETFFNPHRAYIDEWGNTVELFDVLEAYDDQALNIPIRMEWVDAAIVSNT